MARANLVAYAVLVVGCAVACGATHGDEPAAGAGGGADGGMTPSGGDAGAPVLVAASGTRLHARFWDTEDGASIFEDMFDSKLGVTCMARPAEDGTTRCMPVGDYSLLPLFYEDDKCTKPVARQPYGTACHGAQYVTTLSLQACAAKWTVSSVDIMHPVTAAFRSDSPSGCAASGPLSFEVFPTQAVAPTELVALSASVESGSPIARRVLHGDDGSMVVDGSLVDVSRKKDCTIVSAADGAPRCGPVIAATDYFADANCKAPVGVVATSCADAGTGGADDLVARVDTTACAQRDVHYFARGAKRAATPFTRVGDGCSVASVNGDVFDLGAETPASSFPPVSEAWRGGSRIKQFVYESAGQPVSFGVTIRDEQLGTTCAFRAAADGVVRCLPQGVSSQYFVDDQCTMPVVGFEDPCNPPPAYAVVQEAGACPTDTRTRVYALGDGQDIASTKIWMKAVGQCQAVTQTTTKKVFKLGAEVPPSTFVAAKLVEH